MSDTQGRQAWMRSSEQTMYPSYNMNRRVKIYESEEEEISNYSASDAESYSSVREILEVSHWSDTTEESSDNDLNSDDSGLYPIQEEDMKDGEHPESYEERLERWKQYFGNRPLMRCLDTDDEELLRNLMYDRLLEEIQSNIPATNASSPGYRGEWKIRAFWDDVRAELNDEDAIDSVVVELTSIDDFADVQPSLPSMQKLKRTPDGKDPELVVIRAFLMKKMQVNMVNLQHASTI